MYSSNPLTINLDDNASARFCDFIVTHKKTIEYYGERPADGIDFEIGNVMSEPGEGWIVMPLRSTLEGVFDAVL